MRGASGWAACGCERAGGGGGTTWGGWQGSAAGGGAGSLVDPLLFDQRALSRPLCGQHLGACRAKVAEHEAVRRGHQHVLQLQVAVHHRGVGRVHARDRAGHLLEDPQDAQLRHRRQPLKAAAARAHADALAAAADAASVATADDVDFTQNDSFEFGNTLGTKGRNITVNKGGDIAWKSEETPEGRETVGSSVMALEHPIQLHRPQQNWYIWHFKIKHPKLKNKVRVGVIDASYVAWHNIKTANNRDWTTDLSAVKNVKETDTFTCALNCQKRELHVFHNTTLLETHTRIWHNYVRRIWTIEEKGTYLQRFPPDDPELGTRPEAEKTPTTEGDSTQAAKSGFALSVSFT